ncbi:hypothetical protein ACFYE8_05140 [Rhizobium leguminosarum]|uniref:hypothetical protein n=1 Tax=Rhizobium leguminosarum TaxID=384 RepID=UPI0036DDCEC6
MHIDAALAVVVLVLNVLVFMGMRGLLTSVARQRVFEIRDRIFDMAAAGKIDFRSREYRAIRTSLEKLIRYAHDLSLTQFLIFRWHMRRNGYVRQESELRIAVNSIQDPEAQRKIRGLVSDAHQVMFWMMIGKSPWTCYLYLGFIATKAFARTVPIWGSKIAGRAAEVIQIEAETAPINVEWRLAA